MLAFTSSDVYVTIIVIEYRSHVTDSIRHGGKIEGFSAFYDTAMPFLLALTWRIV